MPMTPNIIHTMKHTVKAAVLDTSTDIACRFRRTPCGARAAPASSVTPAPSL
jgi:hypothetical protein